MKTALSLIVMVTLFTTAQSLASQRSQLDNRELLSQLDKLIENRNEHYDMRKAKADSLQKLINVKTDERDKLPLMLERGCTLSPISTDSAINIFGQGYHMSHLLNDKFYAQSFLIELTRAYFLRGQTIDCISGLRHLKENGLSKGLEARYHFVSMIIYATMGGFYSQEGNWNDYMKYSREHATELRKYLPSESSAYKYSEALESFADGNLPVMAEKLKIIIRETNADEKINGVAHTLLGEYYMIVGNDAEATRHYTIGAMHDIEQSNLDEVALLRLGEHLYRLGDTSRAYNYLTVSLENAIAGDMKFNLMRINEAFTNVSNDMNREKHMRVSWLTGLVILLIVMLILVIKMSMDKRREVKLLKQTEERLARANMVKETYISQFLNLCSTYIESLEDFNRMSRRKITAGQTDELLTYIKSGKIIDEQRHKFYDVFDDALLHIFPNYVEQVNALLQPDKQIVTPSPKVLTTELRLLALSRLGIEDATIISRFLGISTNTIYTYRNKLRTRALNRTTFEEDAKKIGSI